MSVYRTLRYLSANLEVFKLLQKCMIQSNQLDVVFDAIPQKRYINSSQDSRGRFTRQLLKPIKVTARLLRSGEKRSS